MFKEFRKFWNSGGIMSDVMQGLGKMVTDAGYCYTYAWRVCSGEAVAQKIEDSLKRYDKDVNRGERAVRRMLVEHLSINPGKDVSGALAAMSMAKDIERIGDYSRNIYGIGVKMKSPVMEFELFEEICKVYDCIQGYFGKLERSILHSDEKLAHEILEDYQKNKKLLKELQTRIFNTEMSAHEAVATALLTQCFVRINAHAGNTVSGVIFPLENIDFVKRGLREEQKL